MAGSGGTSAHINFNEVIANRAQQLLGGALGRCDRVHPKDRVNRSQSTNDVYPTAMNVAVHTLFGRLVDGLRCPAASLWVKASAFDHILHLGRTWLQDARPMTLGQPFAGYAALSGRQPNELERVRAQLTLLLRRSSRAASR